MHMFCFCSIYTVGSMQIYCMHVILNGLIQCYKMCIIPDCILHIFCTFSFGINAAFQNAMFLTASSFSVLRIINSLIECVCKHI